MVIGTRAVGTRRRRRATGAVQDPLFEVRLQPERRFYRQILQALNRSAFATEPLRAESAISRILGVIWASDPRRDGAAEEDFGLGLVEYARQSHTPVAVALLRVLAEIGTIREVREAAAEGAVSLVAAGLPAPGLPLDSLVRGRTWACEDTFGDLTTVVCEFGYGVTLKTAVRHGVLVQVDHVSFSAAVEATVLDDVDATVHDLQYGPERTIQTLRLVEAGWAGAILSRAFARTDLIPAVEVSPTFAAGRALALARVRTLPTHANAFPTEPEPTEARRADVVEEFLRSPEASELDASAAPIAGLIIEFAATHDPGDLIRVSPGRWEAFLFEWLPRSAGPAPLIASVVSTWSAWAARSSGLPEAAREELVRVLDDQLDEYVS